MQDLWALPPRGTVSSTVKFRSGNVTQWTHLCETDGCFAMAHSTDSEEHARAQIAGHLCPAPPRRGINPTGQTLLEKMWNELDDVIDAMKSFDPVSPGNCFRDMGYAISKGYAKGIAECITFCAQPYFKIPEDVLREANRRWKIRQGEIPFSPTPSYRWNPIIDEYRSKVQTKEQAPDLSPAGVKKATAKRLAKPVKAIPRPAPREFTLAETEMVAKNLHEGHMTAATLAEMFATTISRILVVAGPKPGEADADDDLMGAFLLD